MRAAPSHPRSVGALCTSLLAGVLLAHFCVMLLGGTLAPAFGAVPAARAAPAMPLGGGTVAACDEAALRAALAGGGAVTFDTGDCTITLAASLLLTAPTSIDGAGQNVTLSGDGAVRIITTTAEVGTLTLHNITLTRGLALGESGGGLFVRGDLVLSHTTILSNTAYGNGGGAYVTGTLAMTNSQFMSNTASEIGGGAVVSGTATLNGGVFLNNQTIGTNRAGGGLFVGGTFALAGTEFVSNAAFNGGGAFVLGAVTLDGGVFQYNGGGGLSANTLALTGTQFLSNTAGSGGGAAVRYTATLNGGLFQNNANDYGFGGGLYVGRALILTGTQFISNRAGNSGGGAYVGDGFPPFDECSSYRRGTAVLHGAIFLNNTSENCGGGLYVGDSLAATGPQFDSNSTGFSGWGEGGGVYAGNVITVTGGLFQNNRANYVGGGLYVYAGSLEMTGTQFLSNTADYAGGGAIAYYVTVTNGVFQNNQSRFLDGGGLVAFLSLGMTDTQFLNNSAGWHGGGVAGYGTATLKGGLFQDNRSTYAGGGLFMGDTNVPVGTQLHGNTAQNGDLNYSDGTRDIVSALFARNAATDIPEVSLVGTQFHNNTSTIGDGGGFYIDRPFALTDTIFLGNTARRGGGLYHRRFAGRIVNTLFARNTATSTLGAALALTSTSSVEILHTTIASSTVANGAAIAVYAGTIGITNSIVASHSVGINQTGGTVYADYNLLYGNTTDKNGAIGGGTHDLSDDPSFVNPADDDYHLGTGSAAIDAGADMGLTTDFEGDSRPQGAGFDIGFDEATAWRTWLPFLAR